MVELRKISNRTGCKYNAGKNRILGEDGTTEIHESITRNNLLLLNTKNIDDRTVVKYLGVLHCDVKIID